jgi:branched-chain amino acid transport system substrate-binding protein
MLKNMLAASAAIGLALGSAQAQEVKVGVPLPFTGIGPSSASRTERAMELYLKLNADQVKPYKITLIKRDVKDPGGATAKTVVQELITQDKVDILVGWIYSPNAIASAPVVTAGKKLALIMNAGTAHITNLSPYYVRFSFSMWHAGYAHGRGRGQDPEGQDRGRRLHRLPARAATCWRRSRRRSRPAAARSSTRSRWAAPAQVPDFTPFFQRAKDKKPDVLLRLRPGRRPRRRGA